MIRRMAILAWICGLLGLAGTIYIFIEVYKTASVPENEKNISVNEPKIKNVDSALEKSQIKKDSILNIDTPKPTPIPIDTVVPVQVQDTIKKKRLDSLPTVRQIPKSDTSKKINNPETIAKAAVGEDKKFSKLQLKWLMKRIATAKAKRHITTNCVQIFRTSSGNNKKATVQLEDYLRSNHFAIAGRETIPGNVKGIDITSTGQCIRLILGSL